MRNEQETGEVQEELVAQKKGNGYVINGIHGMVGEITYKFVDVGTWVIDHTYVDPQYRGRGIARQLLDFVVEDARKKGRRIVPACSYALEQFQNNSAYADVWEKTDTQYSDPYSSKGVGNTKK